MMTLVNYSNMQLSFNQKEKHMKNKIAKAMVMVLMLITMIVSLTWDAESQMMPRPGPGYGGGGWMGGGMMGGGMGMNQFRVADLNGDGVPEIVQIFNGSYLLILDNEGNVISSNPLPVLPTQTNQFVIRAAGLDVADIDNDDDLEIITEYYGFSGVFLVILDHQGNLESFKQISFTLNQGTP
jgi:hypothetical protein